MRRGQAGQARCGRRLAPSVIGGMSARCRPPRLVEASTQLPGDVSQRERGLSEREPGSRLGRRPPLLPDPPVDPRVRDLVFDDAVFPQRPLTFPGVAPYTATPLAS